MSGAFPSVAAIAAAVAAPDAATIASAVAAAVPAIGDIDASVAANAPSPATIAAAVAAPSAATIATAVADKSMVKRVASQIVNKYSTSGVATVAALGSNLDASTIRLTAGGAGALVTALNLTGPGEVCSLAAYYDTITGTPSLRAKITIDGVVVFDATSAGASLNTGVQLIGDHTTSGSTGTSDPEPFKTSFLLEVASSSALSGSNSITIRHQYRIYQ